ncbi:unnamed protein product, partial [Discosporangium mesarthrocarpum]
PPPCLQTYCFNHAIAACGRAGQDERAFWLLEEMRKIGLTPNRITYSSVMFALGKAGRLDQVR